jgi:hypothetical protein
LSPPTATHPAESLELLSRHHDGDLSAAEREAFETHLAECADCRAAADAFERSLAAFRTAPEAPVPTDLSARILRKIRAQSPSRRPFGVMFGIDIRWAGVFMAALLVAIIAPVLLSSKRELARPASAPAAPPDSLTAYVVEAEGDKAAQEKRDALANELRDGAKAAPRGVAKESPKIAAKAAPESNAGGTGRAAQAPSDAAAAEEPKTRERRQEPASASAGGALDRPVPQAPAPLAAAAPSEAAAQKKSEGARDGAPVAAQQAAPRRSVAAPDRIGGEAGFSAREEAQSAEVRIDVRALDSDGAAPDVEQTPAADRLRALRGREFVLVVEADGFVRSVEPAHREDERNKLLKEKDAEAAAGDTVLRELRFRATGRPRRVLVQVR